MTNSSFPKISDLILPQKGRTGGHQSGPNQSPDSARAFQKLLQSVSGRDALAAPVKDRVQLRPTDPGRLDPMIDRSAADRPRPEPRSEVGSKPGPDRDPDDVDRAEGPGADRSPASEARTDGADEANTTDDLDGDDRTDPGESDGDDVTAEEDGAEGSADEESADQEDTTDEAEQGPAVSGVAAETIAPAVVETSETVSDQTDTDGDPITDTEEEPVAAPLVSETSNTDDGQPTEVSDATVQSPVVAVTAEPAALSGQPVEDTTDNGEESPVERSETTTRTEGVGTEADTATSTGGSETIEVSADQGQAQESNDEAESALSPEGEGEGAEVEADTGTQTQTQDGGDPSGGDGDDTLPLTGPATGSTATTSTASTNAAVGPITVGDVSATPRPTAAAQTAPAEQVVDGEDGELIWRQVRRAIGSIRTNTNGDQQMTIRLRPAELGSVMIRVSTGDAGTTVALVAESAAAAGQLNQQRQQLINELEDGGLSGVAVDVGTSADADGEAGEADADGDESVPGRNRGSAIGQDADTLDRYRIRRPGGTSAGLVDLDL